MPTIDDFVRATEWVTVLYPGRLRPSTTPYGPQVCHLGRALSAALPRRASPRADPATGQQSTGLAGQLSGGRLATAKRAVRCLLYRMRTGGARHQARAVSQAEPAGRRRREGGPRRKDGHRLGGRPRWNSGRSHGTGQKSRCRRERRSSRERKRPVPGWRERCRPHQPGTGKPRGENRPEHQAVVSCHHGDRLSVASYVRSGRPSEEAGHPLLGSAPAWMPHTRSSSQRESQGLLLPIGAGSGATYRSTQKGM
jgi:hypothetical protein